MLRAPPLALVVMALLLLDAALALWGAWSTYSERGLLVLLESASLTEAIGLGRALQDAAREVVLVRQLRLGALLCTAPIFWLWWVRTARRFRAGGPPERIGPLLEWLIPLANLVLPYRRAQRWARGLEEHGSGGSGKSSWLVFTWWGSWLSAVLFEQLAYRAESGATHGALQRADAWHVASACGAALAALACARLVFVVSARPAKDRASYERISLA